MKNFIAIDFETANGLRSSVCSVGVVVVKEGEIVDSFYSLIKPTPNYYVDFCQNVHGLGYGDTNNAPIFPEVWQQLRQKLQQIYPDFGSQNAPFVAHNSPFDEGCLRAVFNVYKMDYPEYVFCDTLRISRCVFKDSIPNHQLHTVAKACGFDLRNHHHALADAEACAAIAKEIL